MKTTNNHTRISRISIVLCSAIVFGSALYAQPYAGSDANNSDEAFNSLETLMVSTEEAVKYVAPSVDDIENNDVEINEAIERLEFLANNIEMAIRYEAPTTETAELNEALERLEVLASTIENEIRYRVVDEEQTNEVELATEQNNQKNETLNALTWVIAYIKNK